MLYKVDDRTFSLSYTELRDKYLEFCELSPSEFESRLPEVLHLTCIICYLKETPSEHLLKDTGLIHEIAHKLHIPDEPLCMSTQDIQQQFKEICKLH